MQKKSFFNFILKFRLPLFRAIDIFYEINGNKISDLTKYDSKCRIFA